MKNSEFNILNNISKKEKSWKLLSKILVIGTFIVCCFSSFISYKLIKESQEKIYVLVNDYQLEAVRSTDIRESIGITTRGHINTFHELFYILQPDPFFIKKNIEDKALHLIDDSGMRLYNYLTEKEFYKDVIAGNYSTDIKTDKVDVDFSIYPFKFTFYGKQKIIKKNTITYRNLITTGTIRKTTAVTEKNTSSFIIENYKIENNKDIETIKRTDNSMKYGEF